MKAFRTWANFICLIVSFLLYGSDCLSQNSNGPRDGSVFNNDNITGSYSFSSPANASANDNNYTVASALLGILSGNTNYLEATGFGFSLPSTAGITGILVEVEKKATNINLLTSVTDNSVRLIKGGSIVGNNYAKPANWTSSPGYYSYGGSNDLWGTTWSYSDINAANFGAAFSARINGIISLLPNAEIDHIRITVYFNIILPANVVEFTAEARDHEQAFLRWSISPEEDIASIAVQRKTSAGIWETIHTVSRKAADPQKDNQYLDQNCKEPIAYYRLQAISSFGKISYSTIIAVKWKTPSLVLYPNPAAHELFIRQSGVEAALHCTGMDGRLWMLQTQRWGDREYKVDIRHLPRGIYSITVNGKKEQFVKN